MEILIYLWLFFFGVGKARVDLFDFEHWWMFCACDVTLVVPVQHNVGCEC